VSQWDSAHPDPILKGIELLGLPADQVWAVGDHAKDIVSARSAGAHRVAVTWSAEDVGGLLGAGAEKVFESVAELHEFLDELTRK
jgi:phosphoglycolate phosphatase-like HAD superfamily hydrolase